MHFFVFVGTKTIEHEFFGFNSLHTNGYSTKHYFANTIVANVVNVPTITA